MTQEKNEDCDKSQNLRKRPGRPRKGKSWGEKRRAANSRERTRMRTLVRWRIKEMGKASEKVFIPILGIPVDSMNSSTMTNPFGKL